jgi:opacity protein-like surface antigen
MKKFVCMMLVVLLVCLSAAALAEATVDQSVIDSFWDTWVGEGDGHYAAEIW